jgi:hypothetical protein
MDDSGPPVRRRLERLCDELQRQQAASRTQIFHHLQPYEGADPDDRDAREWARVAANALYRDRRDHGLLSCDRFTAWGDTRRKTLHVFSGPPDAAPFLREFQDLAEQAFKASALYLRSRNTGQGNVRLGMITEELLAERISPANRDLLWLVACYNLAWDNPGHLNYEVRGLCLEDDRARRVHGPPRPPFASRREFEAWCSGERSLPPGKYWFGLSRDVRACSAEAIRLILEHEPSGSGRQTRLQAHLEEGLLYLTLDGKPVPAFDEVATHFIARLIKANGESVWFAAFIRANERFEGANPTRVMKKIPAPVKKLIEHKGKGTPYRLRVEDLQ